MKTRFLFLLCTCLWAGLFFLHGEGTSWGKLRDPGLSEDEVRRSWRAFSEAKAKARVRGDYPYMACFTDAARKYKLSLPLLVALARGESDFDPYARSNKECLGIMQIKWPGTARDLGITRRVDLFNPAVSIDAGARYLSWLLDQFEGDLFLAIAAYNYGPNAISRRKIPAGARWYAAYIFRHLRVVLSKPYEKAFRELILRFNSFKEAAGFADYLEREVRGLPLEIQASPNYKFDVYFTYQTSGERSAYLRRLNDRAGIKPYHLLNH